MNRQVWGHRGCRGAGYPPENSLSAFQAAIDCGAGGIELDVRLSKDGVPVIFHDNTLDRLTGTAGELSAFNLADLKKLRLLNLSGRPSRQSIPTLEEVLDLVDRCRQASPFVVNIELKDLNSATPVATMMRLRLAAAGKSEDFLVSSFEIDCLREFKALAPEVPIGALFECSSSELAQRVKEIDDLKPSTINVPFSSLTPETLGLIDSVGARAVVWTPDESNPNQLSPPEREQLAGRLRNGEFVMITDFPREVLQLLKPNRARATAKGVLAACLAYGERNLLFRPSETGLENLRSPSEYPELQRFGFNELQLIANDGVRFTVWERKGYLDRPHFLLFHGNRAHWGDTGPGEPQRDRRARLKFIAELASTGAGVTAATLRGFGNSTVIPSEEGFLQDIQTISEHLRTQAFDHRKLVIVGESLGTWMATQAAVHLTRRHCPPALLSLQNPFTCMADLGQQLVSQFPIVRSLNIGLSASALDRHVLKNHFYTARLLRGLQATTVLHIVTSGRDDLVHPSHSDELAESAVKQGLSVIRDLYPDALHHNIPPVDFARSVIRLGVQSCRGTSDCNQLWGESAEPLVPVERFPYL